MLSNTFFFLFRVSVRSPQSAVRSPISAAHSPQPAVRSPHPMGRTLLFVDLFCGAGGASCGAAACASWDKVVHVLAVDMWLAALNHHSKHFPSARHACMVMGPDTESELQALVVEELRRALDAEGEEHECHIHVHASPPCQGFSTLNLRSNNPAHRQQMNNLTKWYLGFVTRVRGELTDLAQVSWSYENVERSLAWIKMHCGPELKALGAPVMGTLRASELGCATMRTRLFIGGGWQMPIPTHCEAEVVTPAMVLRVPRSWRINQASRSVKQHRTRGYPYTVVIARDASGKAIKMQPEHGDGLVPCDRPFHTITCSGKALALWAPTGADPPWKKVRLLSIGDLCVLQGFDRHYMDGLTQSRARRFIGNSIPPPMFAAIISAIGAPVPTCVDCGAPRCTSRMDGFPVCAKHTADVPRRKRKFGYESAARQRQRHRATEGDGAHE